LEAIASEDYISCHNIIFESINLIPAESEEEEYRLKNLRLSEKGFLPFEEAIGIYQPLSQGQIEKIGEKIKKAVFSGDQYMPVPLSPIKMIGKGSIFSDALKIIEKEDVLMEIQEEFVSLCNQIAVADQKHVKSREDLKPIVRKACGYTCIGMEKLTGKSSGVKNAAKLLIKYPISHIFRVGFGCARELKWKAQKWIKESWFANQKYSLNFWDEEWLGVLGGLLIKRPLFFDNYKTGRLYREFESTADIKNTERELNKILTMDKLLSLADFNIKSLPLPSILLTYKNLILTLWAKDYLGLDKDLNPINLADFKIFYRSLWKPQKAKQRKIAESMKTSFLDFMAKSTGLKAHEISQQAVEIFKNLFNDVESEYGKVLAKDLNPKFVRLFLLAK
jgi:hypothetical protein